MMRVRAHSTRTPVRHRARQQSLPHAGWGARRHTDNAAIQRPRKVPVKLEPKAFFAVERTFLSWAGMAVTLAATSSVMTSLAVDRDDLSPQGPVSPRAVAAISLALAPAAFIILAYAYFMYHFRSQFMRRKEVGFYDDRIGPVVMTSIVMAVLCGITFVAYYSYFTRAV